MKSKTKFFTIIVLMSFCLSNAQFVKQHGRLHVSGTQLVDKNNNPVVLRGMSFGWHSMWPRFYNEKAVAWLKKDFKCNVVRAAMGIELGKMSYIKEPQFSKEK
ncbi:glycoside hydrolase family 5 protein, partial [Flavobacterium sp. LBUM151]